ncbi:MAG: cytochrome B [Bacteroidetes bacterium]|nr:cytochrome B [Bacteroidota bacterium]
MYNGILHAHSGLRWVVLITLIYSIVQAVQARKSGASFTSKKSSGTLAVASIHVQFLLGLAVVFQSPWFSLFQAEGMGNATARFYIIEHPSMMLIAVVLATIGNARAKKAATDDAAFKSRIIFFSISLLVILAAIPWPFRFVNAGWL